MTIAGWTFLGLVVCYLAWRCTRSFIEPAPTWWPELPEDEAPFWHAALAAVPEGVQRDLGLLPAPQSGPPPTFQVKPGLPAAQAIAAAPGGVITVPDGVQLQPGEAVLRAPARLADRVRQGRPAPSFAYLGVHAAAERAVWAAMRDEEDAACQCPGCGAIPHA